MALYLLLVHCTLDVSILLSKQRWRLLLVDKMKCVFLLLKLLQMKLVLLASLLSDRASIVSSIVHVNLKTVP